jgi:tripartite-type tricarboxylate transporter receptor subunit TctC
MRRRDLLISAIAAPIAVAVAPALAQERYPERPIHLLVPSVPGGVNDVIARLWADQARPLLGTIVVDNHGGGGGLMGATDVAKAPPDGYTLMLASTTTQVLITPLLPKPPYDPIKDFAYVSVFANSSTSVVIHPSVPATTLRELIAYAKANPHKLSYGSAGNGSITNLTGELFKKLAGDLDIVPIPYKGIGEGIQDLVSGRVPMFIANATAQILELNRTGRVRILAVNAAARIKGAPDIPTSTEAGVPGMIAQMTFGIVAPVGTPKPILARIDAVTQKLMADEEFQSRLVGIGFEPMLGLGPAQAEQQFKDETARWLPIVRATGAPPG